MKPRKKPGKPLRVAVPLKCRVNVNIRRDQVEKFRLLGGSVWLRKKIDGARVPKEKPDE